MNCSATRRALRAFGLACTLVLAAAFATAQPAPPTGALDKMLADFQQQRLRLIEEGAPFEEMEKASRDFAARLEAFLAEAKGMDLFNGKLMLIDYLLSLGERDKAVAALESLDVEAAPALILAGAAEFAGHLQLDERRAQLIEAALAKDEGFENRMALGMHLMTRLEEVEKGEQIFKEAFAAAKDDEQRATVRWYEAAALREREDLHGDEYEKALQALAAEFGDTYFGSVAADRLRSRAFEVGDEAIPLTLRTVGGDALRLADLKGQVVALHFWASWCGPCEQAAPHLAALHEKYGEHGLQLINISFDQDCGVAAQVAKAHGATWPQVCDGKGPLTDAALRYSIDGPPRLIVIGRDGKIAALHLYPFDDDTAKETAKLLEAALAEGANSRGATGR